MYKLTKIRKLRISEANELNIDINFDNISTRGIFNIIKCKKLELLESNVEEQDVSSDTDSSSDSFFDQIVQGNNAQNAGQNIEEDIDTILDQTLTDWDISDNQNVIKDEMFYTDTDLLNKFKLEDLKEYLSKNFFTIEKKINIDNLKTFYNNIKGICSINFENCVILECVRETASRLRIRFNTFISSDTGKVYSNSYSNDYNCSFPKDIREEGRLFLINNDNIVLNNRNKPFYSIKKWNEIGVIYYDTVLINLIRYIKLYKKLQDKIEHDDIIKNNFKTDECCVCLSTNSDVIFVPCAHLCSCSECGNQVSKCPLCRRNITNRININ